MTRSRADGTWVEIEWIILEPDARSENVPPDTAGLPYVGRARGLARGEPQVGETVDIVTLTGRTLRGQVVDATPGYTHSFGRPLPAWVTMRSAITAALPRSRS